MADSKLIDLPAASNLDGTELVYIVQQGLDKSSTTALMTTTSVIAPMSLDTQIIYNRNGIFDGSDGLTYNNTTNATTSRIDNVGVTVTPSVILSNTTPAIAGGQQSSPAIRFSGNGWKTTATAASQSTDISIRLLPVQGTTAPSSNLVFASSVNGAAYSTMVTFSSGGSLTLTGNLVLAGTISGGTTISGTDISASGTFTSTNASNVDYAFVSNTTTGNSNLAVATTGSISSSLAQILPTGATNVAFRIFMRGSVSAALAANSAYSAFNIGSMAVTTVAGTHPILAQQIIRPLTTTGAGTITRTASLYIDGVASSTVTDANYGIYQTTGACYFGGDVRTSKTITPAGTTGSQTINTTAGSVNLAAAAMSLVVTNSLVTTSSIIQLTVASNDANMSSAKCVAAAGSFTIYPDQPPATETRVNFTITN